MKVLMLSTDSKVFEEHSQVLARMKEYGELVDSLHILVFTRDKSLSNKQISSNVFLYPVFFRGFVSAYFNSRKIAKQIKENFDLVTSQDPFEVGLMARKISRIKKARLQMQIHTDMFSPYFVNESFKNKIRFYLAKRNLPKADGIRVVSKRIKQKLHDEFKIPYNKVVVLPIYTNLGGASTNRGYLKNKYPDFNKHILVVSRLETEKNVELMIKAMKNIVPRFPQTALVIVGDGSLKDKYERMTSELGLTGNIIFEGWRENLSDYYVGADMFVHTSNYDGYGLTLIEAASAGCPIVTTNVGLVGDILGTEDAAIINIGDKKALVSAIERIIKMPEIGELLAKNAKNKVQFLPSKEEYLQKYKESWELCVY